MLSGGIGRDQWHEMQRCEPFTKTCGWNESSHSFHLNSLRLIDPQAGCKELENVWNFRGCFLFENGFFECVYYFFFINRFTSKS